MWAQKLQRGSPGRDAHRTDREHATSNRSDFIVGPGTRSACQYSLLVFCVSVINGFIFIEFICYLLAPQQLNIDFILQACQKVGGGILSGVLIHSPPQSLHDGSGARGWCRERNTYAGLWFAQNQRMSSPAAEAASLEDFSLGRGGSHSHIFSSLFSRVVWDKLSVSDMHISRSRCPAGSQKIYQDEMMLSEFSK